MTSTPLQAFCPGMPKI